MKPLVSVVILCWNRKDDVKEGLLRLRQQQYEPLEIIVVDNGSTDGTADELRRDFPEVKLLEIGENIGIEAYNRGFAAAKGEYLVILDDDSFPKEDAIARMVEKFEADPKLGIVAFDVRNYFEYDQVAHNINQNQALLEDSVAEAEDYWLAFNGAGAGVRRQVFLNIGAYPAEFFLYWNEQDTAFRMLQAGYKIRFFRDVVSYHKYSPRNRESWRAPYYYTRNAFWLIWKNYPTDMVLRLTASLIEDCFYYSFEQKTWIYLKALLHAFRDMAQLKGKRQPVQRQIAEKLRIPWQVAFTFFR